VKEGKELRENLSHPNSLDKRESKWEGESYCISRPVFFDGGGDMREENGIVLFDLGQINQLFMLSEGSLVPYLPVIAQSMYLLKSFINDENNRKDYPSATAEAKTLHDVLEILIKNKPIPMLSTRDKETLKQLLTRFPTLLASERGKMVVILLEKKRGIDVDTLWKYPLQLFPKDFDLHMSVFVTENISAAAKCLVLDCYTAVGFHAMRAVECVSRKYYEVIIGKSPIIIHGSGKEQDMGLGQIANELVDKYKKLESHKPRKKPSGELGVIAVTIQALCKNYRDPLSHPDILTLEEDQAIAVFTQAIHLITTIIQDAKTGGEHIVNPLSPLTF